VADRLLALARMARQPLFAVGILASPHFAYHYPPEEEHFRPVLPPDPALSPLRAYALAGRREELWNRYRNSVRYADRLLGGLVAALRRDGLLDRLILIVTGDHGESLLEDGLLAHGNSFHDMQVRVPLLLRYPGGRGRRVEGLTQNADLLPSLFAELGIGSPLVRSLPGFRTLRPEADAARGGDPLWRRHGPLQRGSGGQDYRQGGPPQSGRPWAVVAMAAPHTPVEYLLVAEDVRVEFLFNIGPDGRVVLEARRGECDPARAAGHVADWLDRQGILPAAR